VKAHNPAAEVTDALREHEGNRRRAARALGVSVKSMGKRLRRCLGLWPEGVAPRGPGRPRAPSTPSDAQITAAVRRAHGNQSGAARDLGCKRSTLSERLRRHPHLWPQGVPRARSPEPTSAREVTAALRECNGCMARAAKILGVARQSVFQRLQQNADLWPKEIPRRGQ